MPEDRINVLVTGGARRVGRAIVEDLAHHGFGVAIHSNHSGAEGEALASSIRAFGGVAVVVEADLTDVDQIAQLVPSTEAAIGPLSIIINNASIFENDSVTDFTWDGWDAHFGIHVKAPVALARSLAEAIPTDGEGLVVNIVDQRVLRPTPRYFTYSLSKSAMWSATVIMAQALAPRIRVNAIGPGPALPSARQTPEDFDMQLAGLLLKRGPRA